MFRLTSLYLTDKWPIMVLTGLPIVLKTGVQISEQINCKKHTKAIHLPIEHKIMYLIFQKTKGRGWNSLVYLQFASYICATELLSKIHCTLIEQHAIVLQFMGVFSWKIMIHKLMVPQHEATEPLDKKFCIY